ncbi:MAG TPA: outer membrane beta-barrel protein [Thermoanaerobaculia bacterium]|jgi:opacity protein-like surface antigen|nr:outer membrane beta-barrel protein [Thermoanaerobaculia bacterium]
MALRSRYALAFLGLLALSAPGRAAGPWTFRVEGGTTNYSSRTFSSYLRGSTELRLDGGQSFGVAAEYRPGPRTGIELSLSTIDLDAESRSFELRPNAVLVASDSGTFSLRPLAAAFLFHPSRGRLDFYLGPQLAWVDYQIDVDGLPDREAELAYGGKAGLELAIGDSPWSVGASYRYLDVQHEGVERDQYTGIQLNLISAALSYRIGGR